MREEPLPARKPPRPAVAGLRCLALPTQRGHPATPRVKRLSGRVHRPLAEHLQEGKTAVQLSAESDSDTVR